MIGARNRFTARAAGVSGARSAVAAIAFFFVVAVSVPVACCAATAAAAPESAASFGGDFPYAAATALGGAFAALGDDVTTLLVNPAGLVTVGAGAVYAGYGGVGAEARRRSAGLVAAGRLGATVFGAAASRSESPDDAVEQLFVAAAARNLIEGAAGTFLSVAAALRAGRLSSGVETGCAACGTLRYARTVATADAGMMIRPLPFISLAAAVENMFAKGFEIGDEQVPWERAVRYGVCWLHQGRFTVSWERRHEGARASTHFGLGARTAAPLEIMAGWTEERVTGGVRWDGGAWRAAVVFGQEPAGGVHTAVAVELLFIRPERIYQ